MINWFFEMFVANNNISEQVKIAMTDKDVKERNAVTKYFPCEIAPMFISQATDY